MSCLLVLALLSQALQAQEIDHSAHAVPVVPAAQVHDHSAPAAADDHAAHTAVATVPVMDRDESPAMQQARHMSMMMHGDTVNYLVLGERFERQEGGPYIWEAQGWIGRDLDKLWVKTEGHRDAGTTERAEVQALYSRAIAPYWDLQAGLRRDTGADASRSHAVIGLMGLAPYWFELDLAAFVSERGDLSARLEVEYELRFTQRLLLQPRLELNYSFADDLAAGVGQGFGETSLGLRLRYEIRREFAPYLGVEWARVSGNTAQLLAAQGRAREDTRVVAGLRFWY